MEKTNILIVYSDRIPSVELVCDLLAECAKDYPCSCTERRTSEVTEQDIIMSDVVLAIRPYEAGMYQVIHSAKKGKRKIIVFLDDDLLNLPKLTYLSRLRKYITGMLVKSNASSLKKSMAECDVLWGCNEYLLMKNRKYVKQGRCERADVAANISYMKQVEPSLGTNHEPFRLLYAGGADHAGFLNQLIIPALNHLSGDGMQFKMTFMGVTKRQLSSCDFETAFIPWKQDIGEYRKCAMKIQYDAGIAVLPGEDFYRCKYFNKFIEYSIIGVGGIYTDDEPYRSVVRHKETGLLAENSVIGWEKQIRYAMEHPDACRRYAMQAQTYCREHFSSKQLTADLVRCIPELHQYHCNTNDGVKYRPGKYRYLVRDTAIYALGRYEMFRNRRKENVS